MKQIRIKSGTCPSYLTKGKWYDVIPALSTNTFFEFINDDGNKQCACRDDSAHLRGGSWEVREVKEESMKEHKISDEKLREIYNHPDICAEWKDRIKEAVPTFKVEEWVDITKKMKMESLPGFAKVIMTNYPDGSRELDEYIAFVIPDGTTWKSNSLEFKVEKGRLYRRVSE